MKYTALVLALVAVCTALPCCDGTAISDAARITYLPNLEANIDAFPMYSGYIPLADGKQMFYWLVEGTTDEIRSSGPLLLWLNGGPGCSSLTGLLTENGPFRPTQSRPVHLVPNEYSWNQLANVVYLESPAPVGFSSWPGHDHFLHGDNATADQNYEFLASWINAYPQYQNRPFFITGESFGGHYIPTLSTKLTQQPIEGLDFRGFMVGNPSTILAHDSGPSLTQYVRTHMLAPLNAVINEDWRIGINPYDVLVDTDRHCSFLLDYIRFPHRFNNFTWRPVGEFLEEHSPEFRSARHAAEEHTVRYVPNPSPCLITDMVAYLREADVQVALHAIANSSVEPIHWKSCTTLEYVGYSPTIIPYYDYLMNHTSISIWVYSGDADTMVNAIGTEEWIYALGRPHKTEWRSWHYLRHGQQERQVAGFSVDFDRITFRTVKGSGHMVPTFQPAPALQLLDDFLQASLATDAK
eukprot:CAMPEP_0177654996 /NCGR_PEP_ID=MMETSP0447-20121125/14684_1 /TAXON_ID=0 /ORGANISM="Stygamoeba regulata, Strain BSH-02190019" /LENGTH=466 /DNA_ID=CAMNT_0019158791 /DNA_START=52 /DNA_END=1452 /DNA_ORIENTATION=+